MCACRHVCTAEQFPRGRCITLELHCTFAHTQLHTQQHGEEIRLSSFAGTVSVFAFPLVSNISVHDQLKHLAAEPLSTVWLLRGVQRQKLCIPSRIFTANDVLQPGSLSRGVKRPKSNDSQLQSVRHLKQMRQNKPLKQTID